MCSYRRSTGCSTAVCANGRECRSNLAGDRDTGYSAVHGAGGGCDPRSQDGDQLRYGLIERRSGSYAGDRTKIKMDRLKALYDSLGLFLEQLVARCAMRSRGIRLREDGPRRAEQNASHIPADNVSEEVRNKLLAIKANPGSSVTMVEMFGYFPD